jgi:ubiquinone/menaquinone biosynthesis C-methylase UbiE
MQYSETARESSDCFKESGQGVAIARSAGATMPPIPTYLSSTYRWAYLDARNAKYLDRELVVRTILWGQHRRLERAAFSEILPGQHVLQTACVYGDYSQKLAELVGPDGRLEVIDVAEVQVRNCHRKLAKYSHATVRHENVLHLRDRNVDVVCCYFLMHEMPDDYKRGVSAAMLNSVRPGGKVVFVDYHKPHWANPIRLVTSLVFDMLEPFAKGLWRSEIAEFAGNDPRFEWKKETYFGGLYQKVVATRKR